MKSKLSRVGAEGTSRRTFLRRSAAFIAGAAAAPSFHARGAAHAAPNGKVNWQKHPVVVFENDDWCLNSLFAPRGRETYDRACRTPDIRAVLDYRNGALRKWAPSVLETPAEMQKLFDFLLRFCGADGRPVIFTPVCIVANANCEAIRGNNLERYVEMPIAEGFPDGENPGDLLGKAKEGINLGVWYPQSHGRAHHYHGEKWVGALRQKKDKAMLKFFEFNHIGWPTPPWDKNSFREFRGLQFDDMTASELDQWFQIGMRYFRDAFGYETPALPMNDARGEDVEKCKRAIVRTGVNIRSHVHGIRKTMGTPQCPMGTCDPPGLLRMGWTAQLDPIGKRDEETTLGCSGAYRQILKSWQCNLPAVVGGHRINYCSLDANQVKEGFGQTERLLARIAKEHPGAVYLTSAEVGQLFRTGTSVLRQGQRITCRNYADVEKTIEVARPGSAAKYVARNLRTDKEVPCDGDGDKVRFIASEGEYAIEAG